MSKRFSSVSRMIKLACAVICLSQAVTAGDFIVANREAVLQLTAQIQATQFLTHATFGPTKAEIDALATQIRQKGTIQAATDWINDQVTNKPITLHNVLEREMCDEDLPTIVLWKRLKNPDGTDQSPTKYGYVVNNSTINAPIVNPANSTAENPALVKDQPVPPSYDNMLSRTRYRQHAWWTATIGREDQLRQKTAWALAQIFAVSQAGDTFNEEEPSGLLNQQDNLRSHQFHHFMGLSNYYDIFVRNAFGSYRDVLGYVTYSPIMGNWLSYRGNQKAPTDITPGNVNDPLRIESEAQPDENYAREVMQLFTIGLYMLNDDGTQQVDGLGAPIPTYDNDDIREYAQVFTGLGFAYTNAPGIYDPNNASLNKYSPYSGTATTGTPNSGAKLSIPMRMAPNSHDRSRKNLLTGAALPGQTSFHTEASANAEINTTLDRLVAHQSCPPFICHRLIQRMVKTSPSKAYLGRVVAKFKSSNGNMLEVVKAILLDPEAFQPIRIQNLRSPANTFRVTTMGSEDSRVQEPVLNYTRFTRFTAPKNANGIPIAVYEEATTNATSGTGSYTGGTFLSNDFRLQGMDTVFDQSPYETPSVFNFYYADYKPAGAISNFVSPTGRLPNDDLFAPELQIVTAVTANNAQNFYYDRLAALNRVENLQSRNFGAPDHVNGTGGYPYNSTPYENSKLESAIATTTRRCVVSYDFTFEQTMLLSSAAPPGEIWTAADLLAGSSKRLDKFLEHLDLYFCGGTLNQAFKTSLKANLTTEVGLLGGPGTGFSSGDALNVVKGTMMALMASPSFLVTE